MDRTAFRNFEQPSFLSFIDVAAELDFTVDAVEKTGLGFAVPAILCVNAIVLKAHYDALQVHSFPLRVQAQGHRCTCPETCKQ